MNKTSTELNERQLQTAEKNGVGLRQSKVTEIAMNTLPKIQTSAYTRSATEYDRAADELMLAVQRMEQALEKLADQQRTTSEKTKEAVGRAKSSATQLGDALNRVNRLLGVNFEDRLLQMERLTSALTKLAELDRAGKLQNIIKALSAT